MVLSVQHRFAVFDANVLPVDVAKLRQSVFEDFQPFRISVLGGHVAHNRRRLSGTISDLRCSQQG